MHIIQHTAQLPSEPHEEVFLHVDRLVLAKRRWRSYAADGMEFGFDLEHPLHDGDPIWVGHGKIYRLRQKPEPVLEIPFGGALGGAATLGWKIGNLHFPLEVTDAGLRVADDPAIRQLLARDEIVFTESLAAFHPLHGGGHSHGH